MWIPRQVLLVSIWVKDIKLTEYSTIILSTSCFLLDAYVEEEGSHCLRTEQGYWWDTRDSVLTVNGDRVMTRLNAMDECSKNKRCVGIENAVDEPTKFMPCLDSIYKSTAWDKYEKLTNLVFKKAHNYGKYVVNEAT